MTQIDYLILLMIALSALLSFWRGFIHESLSLFSWLATALMGKLYAASLAPVLPVQLDFGGLRTIAAFLVIFIAVLLLGSLLGKFLGTLGSRLGLAGLDHLLGLAFGLMRGIAIITILVVAGGLTAIPRDAWWRNSLLLPHFEHLAMLVASQISPQMATQLKFR